MKHSTLKSYWYVISLLYNKQNSIRLREAGPQAGYGSDSYKGKKQPDKSSFMHSKKLNYFRHTGEMPCESSSDWKVRLEPETF